MKKPISATLNARWSELLDQFESRSGDASSVRWSYHYTPPFPSTWPLEHGSRLFVYAFGIGRDLSGALVNAVHIAAPWARLEKYLPDFAPVKVRFMAKEIRPVGIQEGRLQAATEIVTGTGQPVDVYLRAIMLDEAGQDEADMLRNFYRDWMKQNSILSKTIRRYHKPFFAWLE